VQRFFTWRPKLRLRYLFLATFTLVAVLPAVALTLWVSMQALHREKISTGSKQHHLAQLIALGLDRYTRDVRATFEHMASLDFGARDSEAVFRLAQNLRFRYLALITKDLTISEFTDFEYGPSGRLDPSTIQFIAQHATQSPELLPVVRDGLGEPTIFVVESYADGSILAAALALEHVQAIQKAITFGTHGHGVIVDQLGQIIAHPKSEWENAVKSLASMAPVQAILAGQTGYSEFITAATNEPAMAAYVQTTDVHWGVLTVRPMAEIEAVAWDFAFGSIVFVAIALLAAMVLALAMARVIVRPVERVAAVAQSLGRGELAVQVEPVPHVPTELRDLAQTINRLARNLNLWRLNLTDSLEEAEASNRAKTNFLASMSHEIRTPLTTIIGFAEALRDQVIGPKLTSRRQEYADDIITAGHQLTTLIDGILELSHAGSQQSVNPIGPVCLREVCAAVVPLLKAQAERDNITLDCVIPMNLPALAGHGGKLQQAVHNLASNAVRFTPSGGRVAIEAQVHPNGVLSIAISDTGIGMSNRDLDIALAPFGRIEKAWTRGRTGTGLGLPLARQLVEDMGGTFAIDSTPGRGTTVTLTFPAYAEQEAA
jgi:signal transduction histidine kinase